MSEGLAPTARNYAEQAGWVEGVTGRLAREARDADPAAAAYLRMAKLSMESAVMELKNAAWRAERDQEDDRG